MKLIYYFFLPYIIHGLI